MKGWWARLRIIIKINTCTTLNNNLHGSFGGKSKRFNKKLPQAKHYPALNGPLNSSFSIFSLKFCVYEHTYQHRHIKH